MRDFRDLLLRSLKTAGRRLGLPLAIVLICTLGGLGYARLKTPAYSATAYVLVVAKADMGPAATNFAQAYGRLAALRETLAWSSKPLPPSSLARARSHIQASSSPDTPLIRLTGSAGSAALAAEYANTAADALVRYGDAHQQDTGVRIALMTQAAAPLAPSSPNPPLNLIVGVATGLLLGGLVAATGFTTRIRRSPALAPEPAPDSAPAPATEQAEAPAKDPVPAPRAQARSRPAQKPPVSKATKAKRKAIAASRENAASREKRKAVPAQAGK